MIGHFLLTLIEEQEDRVLTRQFAPLFQPGDCPSCLVMTALGVEFWGSGCTLDLVDGVARNENREPGYVYENLCDRFGAPRINAAIRNRILSNRARRVLAPASSGNVVGGAVGVSTPGTGTP